MKALFGVNVENAVRALKEHRLIGRRLNVAHLIVRIGDQLAEERREKRERKNSSALVWTVSVRRVEFGQEKKF